MLLMFIGVLISVDCVISSSVKSKYGTMKTVVPTIPSVGIGRSGEELCLTGKSSEQAAFYTLSDPFSNLKKYCCGFLKGVKNCLRLYSFHNKHIDLHHNRATLIQCNCDQETQSTLISPNVEGRITCCDTKEVGISRYFQPAFSELMITQIPLYVPTPVSHSMYIQCASDNIEPNLMLYKLSDDFTQNRQDRWRNGLIMGDVNTHTGDAVLYNTFKDRGRVQSIYSIFEKITVFVLDDVQLQDAGEYVCVQQKQGSTFFPFNIYSTTLDVGSYKKINV